MSTASAASKRRPSYPNSGTFKRVTPERQIGMRGNTNFAAILHNGEVAAHCRAVDLSTTGVVIDRGHTLEPGDDSGVFRLELYMPDAKAPVRALARSVRSMGSEQALRFVAISDADRLTISEHLDRQWLRGAYLH